MKSNRMIRFLAAAAVLATAIAVFVSVPFGDLDAIDSNISGVGEDPSESDDATHRTSEEYVLTIVDGCVKVFDDHGVEIGNGATVTYGQIVTIEPIVPEGKKIADYTTEGLAYSGTDIIVIGDVCIECVFEDLGHFDLTFAKIDGVIYRLDGEEVSGTVEDVEEFTVLTIGVMDGYVMTDSLLVRIDGQVISYDVRYGYDVQRGGIVSVSGVEEIEYSNMELSGQIVGHTEFADYQIVTVSGTCTITEGALVLVSGKLVIPEGTILTVRAGAILNVNRIDVHGTLVIDGADGYEWIAGRVWIAGAEIDGTVLVDGGLMVNATDGVEVSGKLVIAARGDMYSYGERGIVVDSGGTVEIRGNSWAEFDNKGTIVFDSESEYGAGHNTIRMLADGAAVDVVRCSFVEDAYCGFLVTDEGAEVAEGTAVPSDAADVIRIDVTFVTSDTIAIVSGLRIVQSVADIGNGSASILSVSGDVTVAVAAMDGAEVEGPGAEVALILDGKTRIAIPDELVVGEGIDVTNSWNLYVSGTADLSATAFTNDRRVDVVGDGFLRTAAIAGGVINAVEYRTSVDGSDVYEYVTLDNALKTVNLEGNTVEELTVRGDQTLGADATLPAGVTMELVRTLIIGTSDGADIRFTLADGSTLKGTGRVVVNGTLYAENCSDVADIRSSISSDVLIQETEDGKAAKNGWAEWTNISTALSEARPGEVIEINRTRGNTVVAEDIEIPEGVTLYVGAGHAPLLLKDGVTMTVKGTLDTEEDVYAETMFGTAAMNVEGKKSSTIVVEGAILTLKPVDYGDSAKSTELAYAGMMAGAPIYGAYYILDAQNVVSSVAYALENFADINGKITINGVVSSDVSITGTSACDTVFVSDAKVKDMDGKDVATVLTGSVVLNDATLVANGTVEGSVSVGEGVATVDAAGFIAEDVEDELVLSGTVTGKTLEITAGTIAVKANASAVVVTIATGATLAADGATLGNVAVSGVLSIAEGKSLAAGTVVLTGSGSISAANDSSAVVDTIEAGISVSEYTGANVAVVGKVKVNKQIFASTSAVIDEETTKDLKCTTYYVDTTAFLKIYDATNAYDIYSVTKKVPVTNAYFDGTWKDAEGDTVAAGSAIGTATAVYANAVYDIYDVVIMADAGIDDVYLNGIAMYGGYVVLDGYSFEAFFVGGLVAGPYTVEVTLANGFSGDATLYVDGKVQSSLAINASGNPAEGEDHIMYVGQLSGITASGYVDPVTPVVEKDDGLKVTDCLLIVLIVTVAILAVLIALRLLRDRSG